MYYPNDTANPLAMIALGEVSRIVHIHDPNDKGGYDTWYEVHVETFNQSIIQTAMFIVAHDKLDDALTQMGWSYKTKNIQVVYQ